MTYPYKENDAGRSQSRRPRQKNDCTVRAVALVMDMDYDEVYNQLAKAGRKSGQGFNLMSYLKEPAPMGREVRKIPFQAVKGQRRMNPVTFCATYKKGRYIIRTAGHVSVVIDGVLIDDHPMPDARCIYTAWEIK